MLLTNVKEFNIRFFKNDNFDYIKMSKDLFNLDSEATYLNCAYKNHF